MHENMFWGCTYLIRYSIYSWDYKSFLKNGNFKAKPLTSSVLIEGYNYLNLNKISKCKANNKVFVVNELFTVNKNDSYIFDTTPVFLTHINYY